MSKHVTHAFANPYSIKGLCNGMAQRCMTRDTASVTCKRCLEALARMVEASLKGVMHYLDGANTAGRPFPYLCSSSRTLAANATRQKALVTCIACLGALYRAHPFSPQAVQLAVGVAKAARAGPQTAPVRPSGLSKAPPVKPKVRR